MIAVRRILLPGDSNHHGKVFGGAILAEMDLAGACIVSNYVRDRVVTRAATDVEFKKPLEIGDIMTISGDIIKVGRTSLQVMLKVEGQDGLTTFPYEVAHGCFTYVTVNEAGQSILHGYIP